MWFPAYFALWISIRSAANRPTGIVPAITSTAKVHTVRFADAIRNAAVLCTDTSEFVHFLTSSVSAQITLALFPTSIRSPSLAISLLSYSTIFWALLAEYWIWYKNVSLASSLIPRHLTELLVLITSFPIIMSTCNGIRQPVISINSVLCMARSRPWEFNHVFVLSMTHLSFRFASSVFLALITAANWLQLCFMIKQFYPLQHRYGWMTGGVDKRIITNTCRGHCSPPFMFNGLK